MCKYLNKILSAMSQDFSCGVSLSGSNTLENSNSQKKYCLSGVQYIMLSLVRSQCVSLHIGGLGRKHAFRRALAISVNRNKMSFAVRTIFIDIHNCSEALSQSSVYFQFSFTLFLYLSQASLILWLKAEHYLSELQYFKNSM